MMYGYQSQKLAEFKLLWYGKFRKDLPLDLEIKLNPKNRIIITDDKNKN